jgi:hypothetical protein
MQDYKDLRVWEKTHVFTLKVYEVTKSFPREELYSLTSELRRCSFSIPANIAEGCGKISQIEFSHFLNISLASANADYLELTAKVNEIKAMLINLITKVRKVLA